MDSAALYSFDAAFHGGIISPAFPADSGLVLCFLQLDSTREPVPRKEAGSSGKGATGSVKQISAFTYHRLIKN